MNIYRSIEPLLSQSLRTSLTIGNFDGVHRGHQSLIQRIVQRSQSHGAVPAVLTFAPHPFQVLRPETPFFRLFPDEDKAERLAELGVQILVALPFTRELAQLPPQRFFDDYIWKPLRPEFLTVGGDFCFGANRSGRIADLEHFSKLFHFDLEIAGPVQWSHQKVSSSRVREAVISGQLSLAKELLGRDFYLKGIVRADQGRGRQLGFPTANFQPSTNAIPPNGVYVTQTIHGGVRLPSVTNLGNRPTVNTDTSDLRIETHILDQTLDLYGQEIRVEFLKKIRDEIRFSSLQELKNQIARDILTAKEYFAHEMG